VQVEAKTMYEQTITPITNFQKIHHNFELWKNQHYIYLLIAWTTSKWQIVQHVLPPLCEA
jgi:hypothetical protein